MIKTTGQMFNYVATIKKMNWTAEFIEASIQYAKDMFKEASPEEFEEYSSLVGMSKSKDEYGFISWEVRTDHGGSVKITDFGNREGDMGLYSSMNGYGLGGSNYIRGENAAAKFTADVERTIWLNTEEKSFLKEALQTFK